MIFEVFWSLCMPQFYSRRLVSFPQELWNFENLHLLLFLGKVAYVSLMVWRNRHLPDASHLRGLCSIPYTGAPCFEIFFIFLYIFFKVLEDNLQGA